MKVGFIGLGSMGTGMARNLLKAGHEVLVYNRTAARAEALRGNGARVGKSPAEAATQSEVAITMLADDAAVEAVVFGEDGILHSLRVDCIHVAMSTISVALSRRLNAQHRDHGQSYIAAPVFGRPEAAAVAKLFILAAGMKAEVEQCQPLFDAMGQRTFHVGEDPAAAHVMKIAGNFLISTVIESLAESFALVKKSGGEPKDFLEMLTNSLFSAPIYKTYGALVAEQKFQPVGFKLPLGLKDNKLAIAAAEGVAAPMPMASLIHDRFLAAMAQGLSDSDWSAISSISFREAGL